MGGDAQTEKSIGEMKTQHGKGTPQEKKESQTGTT